jgi:glycosyltransferase involved in cell wall biosynthesis
MRDPNDRSFLRCYDRILANSEYTRGWIRRLWGVDSEPLFPPIRVDELHPGRKDRKVLTVGRFFAPGSGHCKKQLEQVEAFGRMVRRGGLDGWQLHVVGGVEPAHRPYLTKVRKAAQGLPVFVHANAPRALVNELFATSSIFWSATGYGEDEEREPWAFEHFGITTVEAMAAECVPVVIDKAGQRETVRDSVDGYRWSSLEELEAHTRELVADEALRERMAKSAGGRAQQFSEKAFAARWHDIAGGLGLPTRAS